MRICGDESAESARVRRSALSAQCSPAARATPLKTLHEHVSLAKWEAFGGRICVMQLARRRGAFT